MSNEIDALMEELKEQIEKADFMCGVVNTLSAKKNHERWIDICKKRLAALHELRADRDRLRAENERLKATRETERDILDKLSKENERMRKALECLLHCVEPQRPGGQAVINCACGKGAMDAGKPCCRKCAIDRARQALEGKA